MGCLPRKLRPVDNNEFPTEWNKIVDNLDFLTSGRNEDFSGVEAEYTCLNKTLIAKPKGKKLRTWILRQNSTRFIGSVSASEIKFVDNEDPLDPEDPPILSISGDTDLGYRMRVFGLPVQLDLSHGVGYYPLGQIVITERIKGVEYVVNSGAQGIIGELLSDLSPGIFDGELYLELLSFGVSDRDAYLRAVRGEFLSLISFIAEGPFFVSSWNDFDGNAPHGPTFVHSMVGGSTTIKKGTTVVATWNDNLFPSGPWDNQRFSAFERNNWQQWFVTQAGSLTRQNPSDLGSLF